MSTDYVTSKLITEGRYPDMGPLMCLPTSLPIPDEPCMNQWIAPNWLHRFHFVPKISSNQFVPTVPVVRGHAEDSGGDGVEHADGPSDNDFNTDSHNNPQVWTNLPFVSHLSLIKPYANVLREPIPVFHSTPNSLGCKQPNMEINNGSNTPPSTLSTPLPEWKTHPTCAGCDQRMNLSNPCLRLSDGRLWHVDCLVCVQCAKPLQQESNCFSRDGKIYCRDDYRRWPFFPYPCVNRF